MHTGFVHADPIRAMRAHPARPCGRAEPSGLGDGEISRSQCAPEEDAFVLVNELYFEGINGFVPIVRAFEAVSPFAFLLSLVQACLGYSLSATENEVLKQPF